VGRGFPEGADVKPTLAVHGLEDLDLVGEALGLAGVRPVVAMLPVLLGADERPARQGEMEREGSRDTMRGLPRQVLEIAVLLPAEPVSEIPCGDHDAPLAVLLDQEASLRLTRLDGASDSRVGN